jgi:hypothetical protein
MARDRGPYDTSAAHPWLAARGLGSHRLRGRD